MKTKSSLNVSLLVAATACLAIFSGCMNDDYAGSTYSRDHARQGHTVYPATILSIQNAKIQGTEGVIGGIGGAVLGGVIGHSIGGGSGKDIATAAGAIGGALAGSALEGAATQKSAIEINVKYENGSTELIVQQPGSDFFQVGQNVNVVVNPDGTKRVRP